MRRRGKEQRYALVRPGTLWSALVLVASPCCRVGYAAATPAFSSAAYGSTLSSLRTSLPSLHSPFAFSSLATLCFPLSFSNSDCCFSLSFSVGSRLSVVLSSFPTSLPPPLCRPPPSGTVHNPCENLKRFIYFLPLPFAVDVAIANAVAAQHSDACSAAAAAPMSHRAAFPANALQLQILAYRH